MKPVLVSAYFTLAGDVAALDSQAMSPRPLEDRIQAAAVTKRIEP